MSAVTLVAHPSMVLLQVMLTKFLGIRLLSTLQAEQLLISLELETHGALIPTVVLGAMELVNGLLLISVKYLNIRIIKMMVLSIFKTLISLEHSITLTSITLMMTGITIIMKLWVILLVEPNHSTSTLLNHKNFSSLLTSMIIECIHQAARDHTPQDS